MTVISMALGVTTTFMGLAVSYAVDMPSGSIMILAQAALFVLALIFHRN
jgi:ABC-type Mn2+/Zn2+ transport system permease subunit